jgi:hypothetical protein
VRAPGRSCCKGQGRLAAFDWMRAGLLRIWCCLNPCACKPHALS